MKYRYQVWWDIARQNLMRYNYQTCWDVTHQVWWKTVIKFDEMLFINFDEIHFVKLDETSLIRFDEMSLMIDESLSSRFDEFRQALIISKKIESNNRNIDDEIIKHDHENEFTKISLKEESSKVAFFDHISHFETKRKTRY
jgi:hypothetical protein